MQAIHPQSDAFSTNDNNPHFRSVIPSSRKFQWLPSRFHIRDDSIRSYINNLHPVKHLKLYGVIEQIFQKFLPLFEDCLADLALKWAGQCQHLLKSSILYLGRFWPPEVEKILPLFKKYLESAPPYQPRAFGAGSEDEGESMLRTQLFGPYDSNWYVFAEGRGGDYFRWKKQLEILEQVEAGVAAENDDSGDDIVFEGVEGSRDEATEKVQGKKDPNCPNGKRCTSKDPTHFAEYAHPWLKLEEGQDCRYPREKRPDESDEAFQQRRQKWEDSINEFNDENPFKPIPFPSTFPTSTHPPLSIRNRDLQVIVKLASIHLTPQKPHYPGGSWHIEGMANEHIIASGIYYYAIDNITESNLEFRRAVSAPIYNQNDSKGVKHFYGYDEEETLNERLSHVTAHQGRGVVFPNIYQHRVAPFSLLDPTRPGYRKILCFFLVHPHRTVLDTSRVPPQQREWLKEEMDRAVTNMLGSELPPELVDMVWERTGGDFGMSEEEAKAFRVELMEERKPDGVNGWQFENVFEEQFSLCEH
ncbi:hypothetical protein HDV00_007433 [Rhizophlyctis rosea]|nr:hypothetical protein HDV00_007433 [Rhizophlyctis rosea]